ncbi:MAG: helix-turn-helix domain-containing protein [Anaerolineae bacterium]|nr:helix-turn-helix domain-containing protein [Anaerolineae bacterium]
MSAQRHQTVRDLLRSALPMGTRLVAGQQGLSRVITWTSVLHTRPPAFPSLEGRELALLSIDALHLLNDKLTLADIINDLAQMEVSAIGVVGNIDARARAAAEERSLPLLNLPPGTSLRHVERDVVKVLVGPPPSAEQRGMEVYQQLLQLSTENRGMAALIGAIADATGKTVAVQDKRLDTVVVVGPLRDNPKWADVEIALGNADALPVVFRDRVEVAQMSPDPALLDMPEFGMRRLVVPIVANRMGRGFFSMLAAGNGFDALDMQFARHGAAVCALEMAKEKAIREAQKKVQGGVLERLLTGTIPTDQALRQLARLGHQPDSHAYSALVACWVQDDGPSDRRLETIFNEQVGTLGCDAIVQLLESGVVVFCADDNSTGKTVSRPVRQLAESVLARVEMQYPHANLAVGIGRTVNTLAEWRASYQEALAAQRISTQWHIYQPLYFGDLGVYRLLSLLLETPELRSFYRETLGELADERYVNDEFITTLETFFAEHGNLSQTASKLHVHRNTLLYRMERIEQIGNFDLENPETRLAVHLALKIRRLLANPKNGLK